MKCHHVIVLILSLEVGVEYKVCVCDITLQFEWHSQADKIMGSQTGKSTSSFSGNLLLSFATIFICIINRWLQPFKLSSWVLSRALRYQPITSMEVAHQTLMSEEPRMKSIMINYQKVGNGNSQEFQSSMIKPYSQGRYRGVSSEIPNMTSIARMFRLNQISRDANRGHTGSVFCLWVIAH